MRNILSFINRNLTNCLNIILRISSTSYPPNSFHHNWRTILNYLAQNKTHTSSCQFESVNCKLQIWAEKCFTFIYIMCIDINLTRSAWAQWILCSSFCKQMDDFKRCFVSLCKSNKDIYVCLLNYLWNNTHVDVDKLEVWVNIMDLQFRREYYRNCFASLGCIMSDL